MANRIAIPPAHARPLTLVSSATEADAITQVRFKQAAPIDASSADGSWPAPSSPQPPSMIPLATTTCTGRSTAASTRGPGIWLEDLAFHFEVSSDEEYVRLHVSTGERSFDMGARVHNYLLLLLARARRADMAANHRDSSCGWVYQDDFLRDPTLSDAQINVHIFRARRQFTMEGIANGDRLIERRPQTRQLRIGVSRISIVTR